MSRIKSLVFWKKFSRILLFLLSLYVIFAAFNYNTVGVAAQNCQQISSAPTNLSPNGQTFPGNTQSATLSWNGVEGATYYSINVVEGTVWTVYSSSNHTGTSVNVGGLKSGASYNWYVRAHNNCGSGNLAQASFSIGQAQTVTCSNKPVFCQNSDGDYGEWVYPDPGNNCSAVCPNQPPAFSAYPSCTINANPQSGNAPLSVSFTSYAYAPSGRYISSYAWDLNGDGNFGEGSGSSASWNYSQDTYAKLRVTDSAGASITCSAFVDINQSSTYCPADTYRCSDGTYVGRNPNNSCQFYACPTQNYCRSISCSSAPSGCYYSGRTTYSCDPNVSLSCGTLVCTPQSSCRSISCNEAPSGCYYSGRVTSTCNSYTSLTCGTLVCQPSSTPVQPIYPQPVYPQPAYTQPVYSAPIPSTPSININNNNNNNNNNNSNNNNNISIRI